MRILGIDPGLQLTGYGCVDLAEGDIEPTFVEAGVIRLKARAPLDERLEQLHAELDEVIEDLTPHRIVVEKLYSHYRHARTAIIMGHARGVVLLVGRQRQLEFGELAATEVKKAVTGHGHATKRQMQVAVMEQCRLRQVPEPPDVADALAIALCAARRESAPAGS